MDFLFIHETKKKCRIGEGCLYAMVSNTGHFLQTIKLEDDYGTDFELKKLVELKGQTISHQIYFKIQLKTTTNWELVENEIIFDLEATAYNNMIYHNQHGITKLIIVIMCLNSEDISWCEINKDFIQFKNSLFWFYTDATEMSDNTTTKRIKIPINNVFDGKAIDDLIKKFEIKFEGE